MPNVIGMGAPVMPGVATMPNKPMVTKPAIKLEKKVKPLHWTRILLMPVNSANRTEQFWDEIKEINLDQKEIETLFEQKV
jgi:hypothetical protein